MFQVKFYDGDLRQRQQAANDDGAVCYVEHHFNSCDDPSVGYTVTIVGFNASETSKEWGQWYAHRMAEEFGLKIGGDDGIVVGGYGGRGDVCLRYTAMPAILVEPLFASNPDQADIIRSDSGQSRLATVLVESIKQFFPDGGLVAFSVGHKYRPSSPTDNGAPLSGGGWEGDYAEMVLKKASEMLGA